MMRLLCEFTLVAALFIALAGCGSDKGGGTNPTPAPFTRLVAAHHQNPGLASVDSPVWDSIAAGRINIGADSAYNAGLSGTTGLTADLKALVSGDSLFIRATWTDYTVNNLFARLHARVVNQSFDWEPPDTTLNNEDRFYVVFDENGTGCKRFCHDVANAIGRKFYGAASDEADVWHWKAHRTGMALFTTNPATLGFAEDMHMTDTMVAPDPQVSDQDNLYFDNYNRSLLTPREMDSTGSDFTGPGLVEGRWITYTTIGQQWIDTTVTPHVGRFVPGYYMQNLTHANGFRWDVRAMAAHNGTSWTVVFCRKLTTGDPDDVDLTSATPDSVLINIAFGNNSGITHYGYKPFYLIVP
jgi:hypothetical protein